jgi:hypothetical protein
MDTSRHFPQSNRGSYLQPSVFFTACSRKSTVFAEAFTPGIKWLHAALAVIHRTTKRSGGMPPALEQVTNNWLAIGNARTALEKRNE